MMCSSGDIVDCLHGEALLCSLNEQRMQGSLCDVTIVVEDTKFKAHRNILAASSLYFRNQFLSQSILIQGHVLELTDFKADTFTEILNYIYSSKVAVKRKEALNDLADAGKKLGITFLENIKTSTQICKRSSSDHTRSSETEENMPVTLYRGQNSLKLEGVEKKGDDPAVASGPRITNAFSILETEVSVFSPLDLRANFKKSSDTTTDVNCRVDCENSACSDGEPVNTLAEHSYAVSPGDAALKRDSVFDNGNANNNTRAEESTMSHSVSTIQETKPATNLPLLKPQCFTPQTIIQSGTPTAPSVNSPAVVDQIAKPMDFCNGREDEGHLTQLPIGNPPITQSFPDQVIYGCSKKQHVIYHCKNCNKEFAHLKRLQRHEQICFKVVHTEKDIRLSGGFSGDITADNFCTSSELRSDQNTLSNITSPGTDHFVKIVDGKIFYVCIVCRRNYVTLSSLRRHSNVHSWRKSYPCHYCNKVFALAEYRTKHEIWHTGDRRYQCIFCLETFMTYYILKNHQKSSHGIDPRLGVGNKTTNRGIKPSIYPYKLYRLLPMKCRRAPLKNSRNGATENTGIHFQGSGSFNTSPIVQNPLSSQPFALETRDSFSCALDAPSQSVSKSTTNQDAWPFDILHSTNDVPAVTQKSALQDMESAPKENDNIVSPSCNMEQNMPSIINCTTSAPSVIMHSSRVSSVIMHGNSIAGTTTTNGIGWYNNRSNASLEKDNTYQDANKVFADTHPTREEEKTEEGKAKEPPQEKRGNSFTISSSKKNKSVIQKGNKTETYIAKPALPGTLVNSGIAPLCQITVKIGSEALVKRQISGSSLFFRKSGRPKHSEVKAKKATVSYSDEEKKERSSVRLRRTENLKMEEMYDDTSDQDISDKPWRPYYNYKPKRKSKHLKKFRKLKKRKKHKIQAPRENLSKSDTKCSSESVVEENENSIEENLQTVDFKCPEKAIEEDIETLEDWQLATKPYFCELCQKSFRNPSTLKVHMRCHTGEKPYPCKTCGKSFSFPGNLTKHERIHLGVRNYTCQYCSKSFMLHESLKKHERIHTGEKMYGCQFCPQQFLYLCTKKNHEQRHLAERSVKGFVCIHCSKVCKTAAALGMHQKKHYLRSKKQREQNEFPATGNWGVLPNPKSNDLETARVKETREASGHFPSSFHEDDAPLLTFNSCVTEIAPQNVSAIGMVENVDTGGELDNNFMTPPPPPLPPAALHESVLMEFPKSWKHWKTRQYSLEESLNSDHSSTRECTKTFTELKTMTNFENPFVP